ncbi:MAG: DUF4924 family protein [Bacteroidales bacterium]|nr:DUF4924 family protein [Bacteroidales bacterium]MBN2758344.1 DUF4924 family protein [Bacteroidales bacterium]
MLIAKEKRKSNIAEYIIYMWQIEDLMRVFKFDINTIIENLVDAKALDHKLLADYENWYSDIIEMMTIENIKEKGHLQVISNLILDLNRLHFELLNARVDYKYIELYNKALPNILEFSKKIESADKNEIEIIFNALYALLLLRIQKKEISKGTNQAMKTFSNLIADLTKKYHQREEKEKTQWL